MNYQELISIETIRTCLLQDKFTYSRHALDEMKAEPLGRIYEADIEAIILSSETIKQYPEDRPYPSVLIAGYSGEQNDIIHVVCAYDGTDGSAVLVTAYRPDPKIWLDYKTRR